MYWRKHKTAYLKNKTDKICVYENEPIIRFLVTLKLTPITIGILFFILISITLTIAGACSKPNREIENFLSFFKNISWSISILSIFPFVIGLTLKYYNEIQSLFEKLSENIEIEQKDNYLKFIYFFGKRINNPIMPILFLAITIVLNYIYYHQILNKEAYSTWISNGDILKGFLNTCSGFTYAGLYSAIIQIFLIYWIFNLIWKSFVFSWGLYLFFNKYNFNIAIEPLHPDGCCGLRRISEVSMIFNTILFFLGIYLALKVMDKIIMQGLPLRNDIGNPIFLCCYGVFAPILFFLPLSASHRKMKSAKESLINPLINLYSEKINEVKENSHVGVYEEINKLDSLIIDLKKRIPVWPFNFKSIKSFFATIITPIFPIILPLLVKLITDRFIPR